jgi:hypothetical protein
MSTSVELAIALRQPWLPVLARSGCRVVLAHGTGSRSGLGWTWFAVRGPVRLNAIRATRDHRELADVGHWYAAQFRHLGVAGAQVAQRPDCRADSCHRLGRCALSIGYCRVSPVMSYCLDRL